VGTTSFALWALDSRRKMIEAERARQAQFAISRLEDGTRFAARGDWNRAIQVLEEATRLGAGLPGEAHLKLAQIHAHRSDIPSATRHLALARALLGDSASVLLTEAMLAETKSGGASQAERALASGGLDGADREYAAALLSRTLEDALSH